ncbi:unnamed protein product [Orchesella dallaii]|uniref:Uncharacterized protein n=1 Tax=Orchesella dallaii TaxID=48710 RepID=A0ABP1QZL2_9HEXA
MDGAYETRKVTLISRFEGIVRDNVKREQFPGKTYTPVFLKTVFLEVLAEQKIPCYQTMGEADFTIAYVAHLLGDCYILSSDSDFMEENNALEVKADGSPTKVWTLQAQFVSIHRLCDEEFQMRDRRLLPLATVILGNDYIHAKAFKSFQALKANNESRKNITENSISKIVSMYEGMDGEKRVWTTLKGDLDLSKWINREKQK